MLCGFGGQGMTSLQFPPGSLGMFTLRLMQAQRHSQRTPGTNCLLGLTLAILVVKLK